LFSALDPASWQTTLFSSRELCETTEDRSGDAIVAVVDPVGCAAASGKRSDFFAKLTAAGKRIAISAQAVEDSRYEQQFRLAVGFDAVFDVGFVSQEDRHPFPDVPYHFVFNGPTRAEEQIIAALPPSRERQIPWAVVGYQTPENLSLVAELIDNKLYSGGVVFLQSLSPVKRGRSLRRSELAAVLSKTRYYVWGSHYSSAYYESFRFVEALLAGSVPCKVDGRNSWEGYEIPNVFSSVQSFCEKAREEHTWSSMYSSARRFYTSRGRLAEHLEGALRLV
jgi:hypothetical protein